MIEFFEEVGVQYISDFKYLAGSDIDRSVTLKPCIKNMLRTIAGFTDEKLDRWVSSRFDSDDALSVMDFFKSIGVKTVNDLKYLKSKDITNSSLLKVVKRKLKEAVAQKISRS